MEKYSVFVLPEIREMILQHLGVQARQEAILACPEFYKTICRIERGKRLKINGQVSLK